MITLGQLIALTQNQKRTWKGNYRLESMKKTVSEQVGDTYIQFKAVVTGGSRPRSPTIKLYSDEISSSSPCKVSCTCNYFRYRLAKTLYSNNSTDTKVGSRIPTRYTGSQSLGLCPHLLKVAEAVLSPTNTETRRAASPNAKLKGLM